MTPALAERQAPSRLDRFLGTKPEDDTRCFFTAFPVLLESCGGAWPRAAARELDR